MMNRRDFLKYTAFLPVACIAPALLRVERPGFSADCVEQDISQADWTDKNLLFMGEDGLYEIGPDGRFKGVESMEVLTDAPL